MNQEILSHHREKDKRMGRRGGKNRHAQQPKSPCNPNVGRHDWNYWQSAQRNERLYRYYINVIMQMAMSRFRWLNLPPTCDERYLEWILCLEGVATIAFPKKQAGTFYTTQAVQQGILNIYQNPTKWISYGNNGWRFHCDHSNGVIVYDNITRFPIMEGIELYANELTHIRMTKQINRMHQQTPWILKGPQEKRQDMVNMFKQVAGGEPAILATNGIDSIEYEVMKSDVAYLGHDLSEDEEAVWKQIYTMLGLANVPFKAERQTEDEIMAQKSPTALILLASLEERRRAARKLNKRFGNYLEKPIEVVLRADNESENWNFEHNIQSQLRVL